MSEPLRSMKQHSHAEHFEEFLRQGLVLPSNFSYGEFNSDQALQDAFEYWIYQFGQAMLPHQTALLCVNRDLRVINACLNKAPFMDDYSQTGMSWNYNEREDNPLARCLAIPQLHVMSGEKWLFQGRIRLLLPPFRSWTHNNNPLPIWDYSPIFLQSLKNLSNCFTPYRFHFIAVYKALRIVADTISCCYKINKESLISKA